MAVVEADSTRTSPIKGGLGAALWADRWQWQAVWHTEYARLPVWSPVLLVIGIWAYFSLQQEPPQWTAWPSAFMCVGVLLWGAAPRVMKVMALVVLGFASAQLRSQWIETPLLRAYAPAQTLTGYVADIDVRSKQRFSVIVQVETATGLPAEENPVRILINVSGKFVAPRVGDHVTIIADVAPLPRPAQPGAFDYGRQLYFQSIGAVGRSKVAPLVLNSPVPWRFKLRRAFHDLRGLIGARIQQAIAGPIGSFADALITGERTSIPRSMNNSLQSSGLFHILSISGLHMALVAGGAFWTLRAALALFSNLALRWPIKKWAAGFAIGVGALYMLLADGGAATERSFIMIAVVFFAIIVDRPALSLHNLAIAAVLILSREPEQALSASFQMSFMAVMGLAVFFVWWQRVVPRPPLRDPSSLLWRWTKRLFWLVVASLATSLVAGLLSSIPAAHHFGRVAPYGVVSNALALPVVSIVVMPAAMISVMLMPFGLEGLPLQAMGWGLRVVMLISDWVASWPGAGVQLPRTPVQVAAVLAFATAMLALPITKLRLVSVPFFVFAIVLMMNGQQRPILLVDERAGNVALVTDHGLVPAMAKTAASSVSRWMAQAGDNAGFKQAVLRSGWTCVEGICTAQSGRRSIAFMPKQALLQVKCPVVDVLIAQEPLRRRCKGKRLTIDRFDVWRSGAHAVFDDGHVETTKTLQGQRPWVYEPRARSKPAS
jgi:competence protein ComEC